MAQQTNHRRTPRAAPPIDGAMKRVRFRTAYVNASGDLYRAGSIYDLADALADSFLATGAAVLTTQDNVTDDVELQALLDQKQSLSQKGQLSGYASLDAGGKVPVTELPATSPPAAHAAAHADGGTDEITAALDSRAYPLLSGTLAARPAFGVAGREYWTSDEGILYRDTGAAWVKVSVRDYPDLDGIPATFAPAAHAASHAAGGADAVALTQAQITGLTAALDAKAAIAAAVMQALVDAKGDLLVGSAADTVARLESATATDGQVLTKDAVEALGMKWAAPALPAFVGARAVLAANASAANGVNTFFSLATETFDSSGFHDTVTNPNRFTVPAGQAGYYLVIGFIQWANNITGARSVFLRKNGVTSFGWAEQNAVGGAEFTVEGTFGVVYLAAGDYVELGGWQNSGGALNALAGEYTYLTLNKIGA